MKNIRMQFNQWHSALVLISGKQFVVPVVDDEQKLVGAISFFSVLHGLRVADE